MTALPVGGSGGLIGARITLRPPVCRRYGCLADASRADGLCAPHGEPQDLVRPLAADLVERQTRALAAFDRRLELDGFGALKAPVDRDVLSTGPKWSPDKVEEIRRLRSEGMTAIAIGQQLGITRKTVVRWETEGWRRERQAI